MKLTHAICELARLRVGRFTPGESPLRLDRHHLMCRSARKLHAPWPPRSEGYRFSISQPCARRCRLCSPFGSLGLRAASLICLEVSRKIPCLSRPIAPNCAICWCPPFYPTRALTLATTSSAETGSEALVARSRTSTLPSDASLPATIWIGMPMRSASLNFTPARSSRSS